MNSNNDKVFFFVVVKKKSILKYVFFFFCDILNYILYALNIKINLSINHTPIHKKNQNSNISTEAFNCLLLKCQRTCLN